MYAAINHSKLLMTLTEQTENQKVSKSSYTLLVDQEWLSELRTFGRTCTVG